MKRTCAVLSLVLLFVGAALAQQASITLSNSDLSYCYKQDASWTLTKTNDATGPVNPGATVNWTVTATKGAPGPKTLCAIGFVSVTNTGSAPATIGNIVVNLERNLSKWTVVSSDVADATNGDAATTDKVLAAALQNQTIYPTGTVSGNTATFIENAYSGPLQFTDADSNTVWNITPEQTIAPGATVNLFFNANFNVGALGLTTGEPLRTEVLVSFGNAGARGGSGASATNIDINGNGTIDPDEANVRTVPTRITKSLPALQICNDAVTITDSFATDGTATYALTTDPIGTGVTTNASAVYLVTGSVDGEGTVTNTASLDGTGSVVTVTMGIDPVTGLPITATRECCVALQKTASSSVDVIVPPPANFCSYTANSFVSGNYMGVGPILVANYATSFSPGGLTIGSTPPANYSANWTASTTGLTALRTWIAGGGSSGKLTTNTVNATSTAGGALARQTGALTINLTFGNNNVYQYPGIGNLTLFGTGTSLDGYTVSQILGVANAALGTGVLPSGYTFTTLNNLLGNLNKSWDDCKVHDFATAHLK